MKIEIVGYELRALRASLARDGVHTLRFETNPTGLAVKINDQGWEPIGTVVKADEPEPPSRLPRVGNAEVFAHFYDRANSRFVILAFNEGAVHPWVVAYVRRLSDSEWDSGRHVATYGDAAVMWFEKVNEIVDANDIRPSTGTR